MTLAMNLRVESPEKKKRNRKRKTKNSSPSSSSPSFSSIPEEIVENCLARISRSDYPSLSIVSKSFRSILSSTELYAARSHLGNTEQCLYICLFDSSFHIHQWFTLCLNPNRTRQLLVPATCDSSSNLPSVSKSTIAVGSEIYVIGGPVDYAPSSAVRVLDCCIHTWRDAPGMNVARMNAFASLGDGKIYVTGGCVGVESCDEVFDIKAQTWERLPDLGRLSPYTLSENEGKIHYGNGFNVYAYDTKQRVMEDVLYRYGDFNGRCRCFWYDVENHYWREVKGLATLGEMYNWNGGSRGIIRKLVSCDGKLLVIWQSCRSRSPNNKKIWCAEIVLEKRDGGEVWGKVEWFDVVYTVPRSCQQLLHCLAVSV